MCILKWRLRNVHNEVGITSFPGNKLELNVLQELDTGVAMDAELGMSLMAAFHIHFSHMEMMNHITAAEV